MFLLFGATQSEGKEQKPYVVEEHGRTTLRTSFDKRMPTSAEQWEYACKEREKGHLKKADRLMLYLVRRWPNSPEAPDAQRARADMFLEQKELKKAFNAYQYLIETYSPRMQNYEEVLDIQFDIAKKLMNKRKMRWFFGGYRTPEYAVDYFKKIIKNGPQWSRAPEAQFLIGQAYEEADQLEEAILSYGALLYLYPKSDLAEEAAWRRFSCLFKLRKQFPNDLKVLDQTLVASTVFLSDYPESKHHDEIILMRNELYEIKAQKAFDIAAFYAKVPKNKKAALLCYEDMIEQYPQSKLVPEAQKQLEKLQREIGPPAEQADSPAEEGGEKNETP